ncbi:MAG: NAD(P)-binding protein, partial [Bacteroidales bacterium]|nr:NAD(P)-binding protein [Bacteroidales bacterium]
MSDKKKIALIIGAGPAGLTAAYELLSRTDYMPVILEESDVVGGISRTVNYKGNRMDIGGHRFFSKSDRVMDWWLKFLPLQDLTGGLSEVDPDESDKVMLVRNRLSRIFYLRRFFDYPVRLNGRTISNLGLFRMAGIGISYILIRLFPIRQEKSLEDFFINRFGRVLYNTFFKDYTEKVWGVPCSQIKPEWGAQRIKGLSISKAIWHAFKSIVSKDGSIDQKGVETSLIDRFLYPKFGPGQLWQEVRDTVLDDGAEIHMSHKVVQLDKSEGKITGAWAVNQANQERRLFSADLVFSTMPVKDLVLG